MQSPSTRSSSNSARSPSRSSATRPASAGSSQICSPTPSSTRRTAAPFESAPRSPASPCASRSKTPASASARAAGQRLPAVLPRRLRRDAHDPRHRPRPLALPGDRGGPRRTHRRRERRRRRLDLLVRAPCAAHARSDRRRLTTSLGSAHQSSDRAGRWLPHVRERRPADQIVEPWAGMGSCQRRPYEPDIRPRLEFVCREAEGRALRPATSTRLPWRNTWTL